VHHGHFDLAIFLIVVLITVLVVLGSVWAGLALRKRLFAGPAKDEWLEARRDLDRKDRRRVQWATKRRRPVDRARLAAAQLAYISYAQDTIKRSPLTRPGWLRIAFPAFFVVMGALDIALAVAQSHLQVFQLVMGAWLMVFWSWWALAAPRSMDRHAGRLDTVRDQVCRRYGDLSVLDSPAE
jgi:hypothetical protein